MEKAGYRADKRLGAGSVPDPDQNLPLLYACDGVLNYNGYCSADVDKLIGRQSEEADQDKRGRLVWEIEHKPAENGDRPITCYDRRATCCQPTSQGSDPDGQQSLQ